MTGGPAASPTPAGLPDDARRRLDALLSGRSACRSFGLAGRQRGRFGAAYEAYCAQVPRWIPRLTAATGAPLGTRFDVRRALYKEHNPFAAWASGALALFAAQAWFRAGDAAWSSLAVLAALEATVLAFFVAVKGVKHRWFARPRAGVS